MKGNFNTIITSEKPVLVDFYATWCGPCKAQDPIIKDLAKTVGDKVRIIKIDIDKNPQIAQKYNVRSVPTIALFKKGELVWRGAGLQNKQALMTIIEKNN